jgi:hypothetical protein
MSQQFSRLIALSSDATTISFSMRPTYLRIESSTAGTAFLSFNTTQIATTASSTDSNSWQLTSGAAPLVIDRPGQMSNNGMSSAFTAIASTGSTATIRVLAVRV